MGTEEGGGGTYLHVNRSGQDVADEQVRYNLFPPFQTPQNAPPEPRPESNNPDDLKPPKRTPLPLHDALLDQRSVREGVEVEPGQGEDKVVEFVLVGNEEPGEGVKVLELVVVGRENRGEEDGRDGKEGHVLDVGVVFDVAEKEKGKVRNARKVDNTLRYALGYEMVDVVVLPG